MFRATFLGNHGWLVAGERARILVDPLLHARYGWTDAVELRAWPPRAIDPDAFPAIDAVLLTHEHEGHFDIASLHLLDRATPIYLSSLSSMAMREAIAEMGFKALPIAPGEGFAVGDLEVRTMAADQEAAWGEEWDNLAHLIFDRGGHGSLFTPVDVAPTEAMWRAAAEAIARPGLWASTNNYSSWDFQCSWSTPDPRPLHRLVKNVFEYHRRLSDEWARPEALLLYGGGFSFGGERSWIDREAFPCDTEEAARALRLLLPGERVLTPIPGDTLVMREGRLVDVEAGAPFVKALPRAEWPTRGRAGEVVWLEDFDPVTGRRELGDDEVAALERELAGFAAFLYANAPFQRLYSLRAAEVADRKPTFALLLRADADGGAYVYEYEPQACRFRAVASADPVAEYLMVYECWGTDLLALLRAEVASASLTLGRSRTFAVDVELFDLDLYWMQYAHPLRLPARFLELYRRVIAAQGPARPRLRARGE